MYRLLLLFLLVCGPGFLNAQHFRILLESGSFTPDPGIELPTATEWVNGRYYRYLQLKRLPTDEERETLEQKGIRFLGYVPANTYIVSVPAAFDWASPIVPEVRSVSRITGQNKLDEYLSEGKIPEWIKRGGGIELVLLHHTDLQTEEVVSWLEAKGATVLHALKEQKGLRIAIASTAIQSFASLPYVSYLEAADPEPQPDNLVGRTDHRSNVLAADFDAGLHFDGTGVSVALNDDGIIGPHIDYQGRIYGQFIGYNNGDHGDHCAGTIFGGGNRSPVRRGMAFGASLGVYGVGGVFANNYQAFDSIYQHYNTYNVRITSTSYSNGNNTGYTTLARLMDIHINTLPDLMHVFSAGNAGTANYNYGAGAGWGNITGGHKQAKNVMTVGNVTYQDVLANSSSRGPAKDGRIKPDICAVGTSVNSTIDPHDYEPKTGTSMSCPGVAGTLAQLYHAYRSLNNGDNPPSALIKAAVLNTGDDLGNPGPDYKHGWGRINARRAYTIIKEGQYLIDSVSQGIQKTHTINVPAGLASLRVMVYWHDKEATAGASLALVNDLDLTLTTPGAQSVLPWVLNKTANVTALNANAVPGVDTLNNAEQVTIESPAAGNYTVSVNGTAVPFGPQTYVVVYELVEDEVVVTYPHGGESLETGVTETIRWDAPGNTTNFSLHYSINNGATWNTIASSLPASQRHFNWTVPQVLTNQALVRVTRGSDQGVSDAPFHIIGRPDNLVVDWVCLDSFKVSYDPVTGATGYVVSVLGNTYMDSVAFSTTSSCVVTNINTAQAGWFTVHAVGPNGIIGRKAYAEPYPAAPLNCTLPDDLGITDLFTPTGLSIINCNAVNASDSVRIQIQNNGGAPISNFPVHYTVNGAGQVSATFPGSIGAGLSTIYTFPQPVAFNSPGTYEITAWVAHPSDIAPANDTFSISKTVVQPTVVLSPLSMDFENEALCDTTENCELEVCLLTGGWMNLKNKVDDDIDWRVLAGPTPTRTETGNTGPMTDKTKGDSTGQYVYLEASNCGMQTAVLLSPCIDLTGVSTATLQFSRHMFGAGMGSLYIDVLQNGQWVNSVTPSYSGDQGDQWHTGIVVLDNYVGSVIALGFRGVTGNSALSDMALDDISLITTVENVERLEHSWELNIHPNPTSDFVTVNLSGLNGKATLVLTEVSGRVLQFSEQAPVNRLLETKLDLRSLASGVYFLTIRAGAESVTRKLIKY